MNVEKVVNPPKTPTTQKCHTSRECFLCPAINPIAKQPKIFTVNVGQAKPSLPKGRLPKESSKRIEIIQRSTLPIAPPSPTKKYGEKCINIRVLPLHGEK